MRSTSHLEDDRLLGALREALDPSLADPSAADRAAFHDLASRTCRSLRPAKREGWLAVRVRPLPALALGLVLLVTAVVATVEQVPATDPLRTVAHSLGLPIESTEVVQTRRAMSDVRAALHDADDQGVADAATRLRERLTRLEPEEGADLAADARALLEEAAAALRASTEAPSGQDDPGTEDPTGTPSTTGDGAAEPGPDSSSPRR